MYKRQLGGLLHFATDNGDGENGINAGTVMKGLDKLAQSIADIFNDLNTRNGAYCINPDDTTKLQATTADNLIFVGADGTGQGLLQETYRLTQICLQMTAAGRLPVHILATLQLTLMKMLLVMLKT